MKEQTKYVNTELIDKMQKIKSGFNSVSYDVIDNMLKEMSPAEKEVLLRLYIYENKQVLHEKEGVDHDTKRIRYTQKPQIKKMK